MSGSRNAKEVGLGMAMKKRYAHPDTGNFSSHPPKINGRIMTKL
jgi:hypothetical protein